MMTSGALDPARGEGLGDGRRASLRWLETSAQRATQAQPGPTSISKMTTATTPAASMVVAREEGEIEERGGRWGPRAIGGNGDF